MYFIAINSIKLVKIRNSLFEIIITLS